MADSENSFLSLPKLMAWQLYLLAWICGSFSAVWPLPALLAFALLFLAAQSLRSAPRALAAIAAFICAFCLISHQISALKEEASKLPAWAQGAGPYKGGFCGKIIQAQGLAGRRVRLVLERLTLKNHEGALPLFCSLTREDDDPFFSPAPGQTVCFKGSVRKNRSNLNTQNDLLNPAWKTSRIEWRAYSAKNSDYFEISGSASALYSLRESLRADFLKALGFKRGRPLSEKDWRSPSVQARAILLALCFGDRRLLSRETGDNFAAAAIAHSLALSGQHLGTAALFAVFIIWLAGARRPEIFLRFPRLFLTAALALPLALLYLWIGNAPPSLLRAAGMLLLLAFLIWRQKAFSGLDLIFGAMLLFALFKPLALFDLGLQLSVLCVLTIILFAPAIARLSSALLKTPKPFSHKLFRRSFEILLVSLLIQAFLLPQSLLHFSNAGLHFPLNLIWLPVLGLFVLPAAFLAVILSAPPGCLPAAAAAAKAAALPCAALLKLLGAMRARGLLDDLSFVRPHWLFLIIFTILAGSLAWLWAGKSSPAIRQKCLRFIALALALSLIPPALRLAAAFHNDLRIEVLDAGQGLSALIQKSGVRILYDGGGNPRGGFDPGKNIVAPVLDANAPPRVDAVINSHPDMDHLGGLFHILEAFKTGLLFHNGREAAGEAENRWRLLRSRLNGRELKAGDIIHLDKKGLELEVLHPTAGAAGRDWRGNSASLVMRLTKNGEGLLLLTGDAEKDTLESVLKSGREIKSRVVIAPHHGSDRSFLREFYRRADPELVLAGCAYQNRWGYPGKKLKSFLKEAGVPLLDTGTYGRISAVFDDEGALNVSVMNQEAH